LVVCVDFFEVGVSCLFGFLNLLLLDELFFLLSAIGGFIHQALPRSLNENCEVNDGVEGDGESRATPYAVDSPLFFVDEVARDRDTDNPVRNASDDCAFLLLA